MNCIEEKIETTIKELKRLSSIEYSEYNAMNNDPTPDEEMKKILINLLQDCQKKTKDEIIEEIGMLYSDKYYLTLSEILAKLKN